MKSLKPHSLILILLLFAGLNACVGGGALDGGSDGTSISGGGVGQGQPTIQPGADHQPGTPIEDGDKTASDDLAIPPPPPPTDEPGPGGPTDLKTN